MVGFPDKNILYAFTAVGLCTEYYYPSFPALLSTQIMFILFEMTIITHLIEIYPTFDRVGQLGQPWRRVARLFVRAGDSDMLGQSVAHSDNTRANSDNMRARVLTHVTWGVNVMLTELGYDDCCVLLTELT